MRRTLLALAVSLIAGAAAMAAGGRDPTSVKLGAAQPFVVVTKTPSFTAGETYAFYALWDRITVPGRTLHVVRRESVSSEGAERVAWASSRDCPALTSRLARLAALPTPRPEVPGLETRVTSPPALDGIDYSLWARFGRHQSDAFATYISYGGNMDTPLAAWTEELVDTLKGCWRDTPPTL